MMRKTYALLTWCRTLLLYAANMKILLLKSQQCQMKKQATVSNKYYLSKCFIAILNVLHAYMLGRNALKLLIKIFTHLRILNTHAYVEI